jgi:hypothetical protein
MMSICSEKMKINLLAYKQKRMRPLANLPLQLKVCEATAEVLPQFYTYFLTVSVVM